MKTYLAEATGNTFILADCLSSDYDLPLLHQMLEKEDRDDALIISEPTYNGDTLSVKFHVYGRDGQFGEFCANGARAISSFLHQMYPGFEHYSLRSVKGEHKLKKIQDTLYSVSLPAPYFGINPLFIADPLLYRRQFNYDYVEMIEPHLVIKGNISESTLFSLGRDLNGKKKLFPKGINVNAWHQLENGNYFVQTYERGVQRLTGSCGTGSLSCAALLGISRLTIETKGGKLSVHFDGDEFELIGNASVNLSH